MFKARKLLEKGKDLIRQGSWERASEVLKEAHLELDGSVADDEARILLAEVLRKKAHADSRMAQLELARRQLKRAMEISRALDDTYGLADALRGLGYVNILEGNSKEALKRYERALDKARACDDKALIGKIFVDIGNVRFHEYDFEGAKGDYNEAVRILEGTDDRYELARAYNNLGDAFKKAGDCEEAIEILLKAMDIADKAGNIFLKGIAALNAAECHTLMGKIGPAKEYIDTAMALLKKANDNIGIAHAWLAMGQTFLAEKAYMPAERALKKCQIMAVAMGMPVLEAMALRSLGDLNISKGDKDRGEELLRGALDLLERNERSQEAEEVRKAIGELRGAVR